MMPLSAKSSNEFDNSRVPPPHISVLFKKHSQTDKKYLFVGLQHLPKILGQRGKSTTKVTVSH